MKKKIAFDCLNCSKTVMFVFGVCRFSSFSIAFLSYFFMTAPRTRKTCSIYSILAMPQTLLYSMLHLITCTYKGDNSVNNLESVIALKFRMFF